ncbi:hypothetical protein D9615_009000 [Tricholomella constricta]|uniref:Uncharacterized protein n=1 Tax=Tricholomella constricta TaxID=117010 RepID=A0A8H5H1G5_9AGAR|nr:hypothetical protein D9615_009000 [Tricholomella constricta]
MPTAVDSNAVVEAGRKFELWRVREGLIDSGDEGVNRWDRTGGNRSFVATLSAHLENGTRRGYGSSPRQTERTSKATAEQRRIPTSQIDEKRRITDGRENIQLRQLSFDSRRTVERNDRHPLDLERRLTASEKEKQNISEQLQRTITRLESSEQRNRDLEERIGRLSDELKAKESQLRQSEARYQTTAQILDETASELKTANLFLTKTDSISTADGVAMVDALNAEIMQLAAFMADMLEDKGRGQEKEQQAKTEDRKFNLQALGEPLVQILRQNTTQNLDPMIIQISLQLCLAETCAVVVGSWSPGLWNGEDILWKIYSSLKRNAAQAVAGRWRAITRSQTMYQECYHPVLLYFIRRVEDVLSLAGWPKHLPENSRLLGQFKKKSDHIVTLTFQLHKALGEDIISGEMKAHIIYPNARFDEAAMDDAFPDDERLVDSEKEEYNVCGTTDLGLCRMSGNQATVLRKPKVVLASALQQMLCGR